MPGARNLVGWNVSTPSHEGFCTLRLGAISDERSMTVLHPLDGSGNEAGSFPCGRNVAEFEGKEVRFPHNTICDSCIMQLEWKTEFGD
jgi:hypothetical protein